MNATPLALLALALLGACRSDPALPDYNDVPRPAADADVPAGAASEASEAGTPAPAEAAGAAAGQPASAELPGPEVGGEVLGRVGALRLTVADLVGGLSHRQRDVLWGEVNRAVGQRLARQEAARIGLRIDPREVDRRSAAYIGDFAREVVPEDMDLEEFVTEVMQRDPAGFRAAVQEDTLGEMVLERVVRAYTLGQEHARVRILVADAPTVASALERLEAGEDFVALVGELSRDPSASSGGLVPYVVNSPQSPLARLAFTTPVGEIGGPLESRGGPSLLVRVDERPEPLAGDWSAVGPAVEASLSTTSVAEEEFLFWQIQMEKRYQVDLNPLLELIAD